MSKSYTRVGKRTCVLEGKGIEFQEVSSVSEDDIKDLVKSEINKYLKEFQTEGIKYWHKFAQEFSSLEKRMIQFEKETIRRIRETDYKKLLKLSEKNFYSKKIESIREDAEYISYMINFFDKQARSLQEIKEKWEFRREKWMKKQP